MLQNYFINN